MRAVDLSCRMDSLAAKRSESTTLRLSQMKFRLPHATIMYVSLLHCQCTSSELYRVPPDHSGIVDIGPMGFGNFMDFAMDSYGDLYAVASPPSGGSPTGTSSIYSINTSTGAGTLVGLLSNNPCLMGIAFDRSDNLFATEYCGGPWPLYEINNLSSSNPGGATATAIGTNTGVTYLHGAAIDNFTPEPASLMLCLLGGVLLAARKLHA